MTPEATVFVVDDDERTRHALGRLLESAGLKAKAYFNAQEFLEGYDPARPGCLVLDIRMPGMSGLELQELLASKGIRIPVIVVSAYGEVENVVRAMRTGAVDFIKKPYRAKVLLERIRQALDMDARNHREDADRAGAAARLGRLSQRELQVLRLLVDGRSAKEIAHQLGLSRTTVDVHRRRIMIKLQAHSLVDLVRIARL